MKARLSRLRVGGVPYVQVVVDQKTPKGDWTTRVLGSFGRESPDSLAKAELLTREFNGPLTEAGAPYPSLPDLPAGHSYTLDDRSSVNREVPEPLVSPETRPIAWALVNRALELFLKSRVDTREGIAEVVRLTQSEMNKAERARFVDWIWGKEDIRERERLLSRTWTYTNPVTGEKV